MKHISENELVDMLFCEEITAEQSRHLEQCPECNEQYQTLQEGLKVAGHTDPGNFTMGEPLFRSGVVPGARRWKQAGLMIAAVFLLMSFLGFKVEMGEGRFSVQFSMFSKSPQNSAAPEQFAELEARLLQAINLQAAQTATQINDHFQALDQSQYRKLVELSIQVKDSLSSSEIQTDRRIAMLNRDLEALKTQSSGRRGP